MKNVKLESLKKGLEKEGIKLKYLDENTLTNEIKNIDELDKSYYITYDHSNKGYIIDKSRKNDYDRLYKERTLKDTVNLVKSIN